MKKYLLAIDAGTGSVRAIVFDFNGNEIGAVSKEWTHNEDYRWPGSMDFDWVKNWNLTKDCIKSVISKTKIDPLEIAGISTTCMREGILLYDDSLNEIWACANVDARSVDEVRKLIESNKDLEKEIYYKTGETYALGAIPRILWVKDKLPETYEKTAKVGMFNDWLILKLTGVLSVEPSNGSTTGILNLKTRQWDLDIAKQVGIKTDIFPTITESGVKIATISKKGASETGLVEGTPVIVGGGDCQLGVIGVGASKAGQAAVFGGSFWQYEFNTNSPKTDKDCRVRVNCHAVNGVWQYEALAFKPGLVMRWFRDAFCDLEKSISEQTGIDTYELMNDKAKDVPAGSHGMICCFSDVMNFIEWKHASPTFTNFGLDSEKFNRVTFYRAILENTALLVKGHIDLVKEATGDEPDELIFASGASKSKLWSQILADVTGKTVKVPVVKEATALGAAILAGVGAGIYKDVEEGVSKSVRIESVFTPNPLNKPIYDELYTKWKDIYKAQLNLCDKGLVNNMWKAPGL